MRHVVLPAGTESVRAEEVAPLLARAFYPPAEDEGLSRAIGRVNAEEEHGKAARRAAMLGELPVYDHAGLPTSWSPRARLRVADFIAYAARFEVSVTVTPDGADARASITDPKTAPIDWAAYRFRDGFTLFEVACLLHRLDPRAVSDDAHHAIRRRGGTAAEVLKNPAATAEMLHLNPAAFFMPPVGDTLERLKRAAGSRLGLSVNGDKARELAAMLGLPYPPELEFARHFDIHARRLKLQAQRAALLAQTPQTITEHKTKREELDFIEGALRALDEEVETANAEAPAAEGGQDGANRWTPDRLQELRAYRAAHGTKKAAEHFGISQSRVRALLPGDKPQPKGYSAFNPRAK